MADPRTEYQRQAQQQRRDELILSHLPLVKHVIGRLVAEMPPGIDLENLEAAGVLGLVEAAAKFDPERNTQFKTFAYLRVRGAILDELRRNCPLPQQMIERVARIRQAYRTLPAPVAVESLAQATGMTLDEVTETLAGIRMTKMISWEQSAQPNGLGLAENEEPPEAELEREERVQQVTTAIESLGERERLVVTLYYREDLRLKEISAILKLSESRVSRILGAGLFEIGEHLRAKERATENQGERNRVN